jgi:hypothetical protein
LQTTRATFTTDTFFFSAGVVRLTASVIELPSWSLYIVDQCPQTQQPLAFFSVTPAAAVSSASTSIAHPGCDPVPIPIQLE